MSTWCSLSTILILPFTIFLFSCHMNCFLYLPCRYWFSDPYCLTLYTFSWHFEQARIALERRRFLKNADTAVHRQAMWSNLAHEMTAEFRGLCAEEVRDMSYTFLYGLYFIETSFVHGFLMCSLSWSFVIYLELPYLRPICSKSWKNYKT